MCCVQGLVLLKIRAQKAGDLIQYSAAIEAGLVQTFFPCSMLDERIVQTDVEQGNCASTGQ